MAKKKQKKQQGQQFLSPEQYMKQRARTLEIGKCYMTDITEVGEGHILVTRNHTGGKISMAVFLVDAYCLGVKDSFYRLRLEDYELEEIIDKIGAEECTYEEAHNWIYGSIAYAEEAGIEPDKSFNLTRYMLEEDTDDIPLIEYEFGKDGKHMLVAHSHLEASRYLPLLKQNLGEGNYDFVINDTPDDEEEDAYNEDGFDLGEMAERLKNWKDSPMFKTYGPDVEYTYQHPDYPKSVSLHYPWLQEELAKPENDVCLKDELTDRILALPHEELRQDLEQLIIYHIGLTCDYSLEAYDNWEYNGTLSTALMLIAEVGNDTTSLDAVLEVMRQSVDFFDYHFGDSAHEVLPPTIYKLGQHQLDRLLSLVKEEGLSTHAKYQLFPAVVQIALRQPERRSDIVEWFRQVLRFATNHIKETKAFDSTLAGLLMCDVIDLQAIELQPEVKALFDTNLVDLGICGKYGSVIRDMSNPRHAGHLDDCILDIHERFEDMRRRFDRNN
ncbi:MAG: hypothetical protein IJ604_07555 [Prevotella sp.]|nr:hypothetical protein [Prevotella sp.]